ncbi:MAG: metallophosphoesterase [Phycisphaerae bacterium]|nr:metallophosphoesterase [Phycisphaerae bacterium]
MSHVVADIFRQGTRLNIEDPRRQGNVIVLGPGCELLVSGDIHGNRRGLNNIITHGTLKAHSQRHLVLQEIEHGPIDSDTGHDRSIELLMRAVRLKIVHPSQVLFIMGNHSVAQISGSEISKGGYGACKAFADGVHFVFGENGPEVLEAVEQFMRSLPLAVRCPGGVLISHSLPSPHRMDKTSTGILSQTTPVRDEDLRRGGSVYEWTWGRKHTAEHLDALAAKLGVGFFLLGHQHTDAGYTIVSQRAAVIVSDHSHGYVVQFPGDQSLSGDTVEQHLKPLTALNK